MPFEQELENEVACGPRILLTRNFMYANYERKTRSICNLLVRDISMAAMIRKLIVASIKIVGRALWIDVETHKVESDLDSLTFETFRRTRYRLGKQELWKKKRMNLHVGRNRQVNTEGKEIDSWVLEIFHPRLQLFRHIFSRLLPDSFPIKLQ